MQCIRSKNDDLQVIYQLLWSVIASVMITNNLMPTLWWWLDPWWLCKLAEWGIKLLFLGSQLIVWERPEIFWERQFMARLRVITETESWQNCNVRSIRAALYAAFEACKGCPIKLPFVLRATSPHFWVILKLWGVFKLSLSMYSYSFRAHMKAKANTILKHPWHSRITQNWRCCYGSPKERVFFWYSL